MSAAKTETHEQWAVRAPNGAYVTEADPASRMTSGTAYFLTTDPTKALVRDDARGARGVAVRYAEIAERIGIAATFEVVRRRVMVVYPEFEAEAEVPAEPDAPF